MLFQKSISIQIKCSKSAFFSFLFVFFLYLFLLLPICKEKTIDYKYLIHVYFCPFKKSHINTTTFIILHILIPLFLSFFKCHKKQHTKKAMSKCNNKVYMHLNISLTTTVICRKNTLKGNKIIHNVISVFK